LDDFSSLALTVDPLGLPPLSRTVSVVVAIFDSVVVTMTDVAAVVVVILALSVDVDKSKVLSGVRTEIGGLLLVLNSIRASLSSLSSIFITAHVS
jgi:hypothetical protein